VAFVNYNNKEITAKIVYYGPALSGKTTGLRYIYGSKEIDNKGKLITLDTDGDRTLFFDFLPLEIGKLGNYSIKIQLYTVPGQVAYDTTRKLVLQGADGIVFVADSQMVVRDQNIESFHNLKKNLRLNNLSLDDIPLIFEYNKRDLREILPIDLLNKDLNPQNRSFFPTIATTGENILEGLHSIIKLVIIHLKNRLSIFQKEKTVMFSRDEITSSTPKNVDVSEEIKGIQTLDQGESKEAGEESEIFELSAPLETGSGVADEIFTLGDGDQVQETPAEPAEIEIPGMEYLSDETEGAGAIPMTLPLESEKPTSASQARVHSHFHPAKREEPKKIDIPITLEIGEKDREILLNLKLKIVIKKA
jgi:signal recognition particle receptor subunit beta